MLKKEACRFTRFASKQTRNLTNVLAMRTRNFLYNKKEAFRFIKYASKYNKKICAIFTIAALMVVNASAREIYSYETEKEMTAGVSFKNVKRFFGDYSLNISCVKADLTNPHISLELLKSNYGCDKTATVSALSTTEDGIVAATNADFFSAYKGNQNFSLGIEIKDGKLLQSHIESSMAAGLFDGETLDLSYISLSSTVTAANGTSFPVTHINKPTDYYGALLMYTSEFNGGVSPYLPEGISVATIENDKVTALGVSMGGTVPIPENGYILVINESMTPFLYNLSVGEDIELDITATPSINDTQMAFGGGTMLLSGGKKTPITHSVNGTHPRTAIGTSDDGKTVYFITVDGRQSISQGATLDELADICLELGCTDAINLDGGGSTNMVGKTLQNNKIHTLNSPSEDRRVINAVAIISDAKPGNAVGFEVKAENYNVLVGDSVKIDVTPFDENHNPPSSVNGTLEWKISKGGGRVENNVFYAGTSGETVLDLYYNNKWMASCVFNVIGNVSGISAKSSISITQGKSEDIGTIEVFDKDGNTATVKNLDLLNPHYDAEFIKFQNNKITPLKNGAGEITFSHSGAYKSIKIVCGDVKGDASEAITKDSLNRPESDGFIFNVASMVKPKTLLDCVTYARMMDVFEKSGASAVIGGGKIEELTPDFIDMKESGSFSDSVVSTVRVLTLKKTSSGSLRTSGQWDKIKNAVADGKEKNMFILLDSAPVFKDTLENQVFADLLSEASKYKNIFVIYGGEENSVVIKNGVRYISLADIHDYSSVKSSVERYKYLSFNINGDNVSYTFEPLINEDSGIVLE